MIQVNEEYLGFRGETSHTLGYINRLVEAARSDSERKAGCLKKRLYFSLVVCLLYVMQ